MWSRLALGIAAMGFVAACGGADGAAGSGGSRPAPHASTAPTAAQQSDAGMIVGRLQATGLPITNVEVYTAANDQNKLLGRPGQYISKANWQDKRDSDTNAIYTVETFANAHDRDKRMQYVHGTSSSASI